MLRPPAELRHLLRGTQKPRDVPLPAALAAGVCDPRSIEARLFNEYLQFPLDGRLDTKKSLEKRYFGAHFDRLLIEIEQV